MRNLLLLLVVLLSTESYAQKAAVQTANNYLGYGELDKAREAIDGAIANESTSGMAKTWFYRGKIYHAIYESNDAKYASLKPGALDEVRKSYEKTIELDSRKEFEDEVKARLSVLNSQFLDNGVNSYKAGNYPEALMLFETAAGLKEKYFHQVDTLAIYNAALSADKGNKKEVAIKYYSQLATMNYGGAKVYSMMASSQLAVKDTVAALESINKGRQQFPADNNLVIQGLNIYLSSGRDREAMEQLNTAIEKDPGNANLYYAKGTISDKLGNADMAATSYKKAIELKPDHFEANYNLGAMYFNKAAEMANKANDIPASKTAEFDAAKKKFDAEFALAKPYLERAHELNPSDQATMQSLRQIYARLGDLKKAGEIKQEMEKK